VRKRYQELKGAPPEGDCLRWPERGFITGLIAQNREYRLFLEYRLKLEKVDAHALHEAVVETDALYQALDAMRDARTGFYYVSVRRQALQKLRELIGPAAYYAGVIPSPVPVWRFSRID
jgi:hypothetical protein